MEAVFIKPSSWHYRLQEFAYGEVPYRHHFCPYFWITIFTMMILPLILVFRVCSWVFDSIFNFTNEKIVTKKTLSIEQWIEENLTDDYKIFRFYEFYAAYAARLDWPLVPRSKRIDYMNIWDHFCSSPAFENYPFNRLNRVDFTKGDHEAESANHDLLHEYLKQLQKEYKVNFQDPVRAARKISEAKAAKRREYFSWIAQYTRIPVYFCMGLVALLAIYFSGILLGYVGSLAYLYTAEFIGSIIGIAIVVYLLLLLFVLLEPESDFQDHPRFMVVALGVPRRLIGNFFDRLVFPTFNKIGESLSIFGSFLNTIYEGSCPNMIIEGDDLDDNHRLGE